MKILEEIRDYFWLNYLTIKYFAQGDTWEQARNYAEIIVKGYRRQKERK